MGQLSSQPPFPTVAMSCYFPPLTVATCPKLLGDSWNPICIFIPNPPNQKTYFLILASWWKANIQYLTESPMPELSVFKAEDMKLRSCLIHLCISWTCQGIGTIFPYFDTILFQSKTTTPGLTTWTHLDEEDNKHSSNIYCVCIHMLINWFNKQSLKAYCAERDSKYSIRNKGWTLRHQKHPSP